VKALTDDKDEANPSLSALLEEKKTIMAEVVNNNYCNIKNL